MLIFMHHVSLASIYLFAVAASTNICILLRNTLCVHTEHAACIYYFATCAFEAWLIFSAGGKEEQEGRKLVVNEQNGLVIWKRVVLMLNTFDLEKPFDKLWSNEMLGMQTMQHWLR